jgi:DNA polymerase III epsilon subunit-like protein
MLNTRDIMKLPLSEAQASFFKDKGITQQYKNPRLEEAHIHFMGYGIEGAHDAMVDVRACKDVYFKLHSLKEVAA